MTQCECESGWVGNYLSPKLAKRLDSKTLRGAYCRMYWQYSFHLTKGSTMIPVSKIVGVMSCTLLCLVCQVV